MNIPTEIDMKPIILSGLVCVTTITGCSIESKQSIHQKQMREAEARRVAYVKKSQESLRNQKKWLTPSDPTDQQKRDAKSLSRIYYIGVADSVAELDDGVSPADVIARAAIGMNRGKLIAWKTKSTEHFRVVARRIGEDIDSDLRRSLPSRVHVNEATAMVLKHRKDRGHLD